MTDLRSFFSGLVRRVAHHDRNVRPPTTAPEVIPGAVLGGTVRTSVDQAQVIDGHISASVLHDVLVTAGAHLDSNDMAVAVGTPRLISSNFVTSSDGKFIDREEEIEIKVVIKTKERLSLFVDALAGATVDGATLTLTPRSADKPTVTTTVDGRDT